ncbi:MEDS domain-containing protein [Actinoplanes xinjiangensis]|uniref:MEDS domain-containing protein n=1 Tax=Actinoplanes xinjiangensis TaxID=512350 RepID=UPI003414D193
MSPVAAAGHVCWPYDDHPAFEAHAAAVLRAGLEAGEQVWYVPGDGGGAVAGLLTGHPRAVSRADAVRVVPLAVAYPGDLTVDPAAQVTAYTAATEDALAAGFTGLRVVADATAFVRTEAQRDAFARYEYAIGRYMRTAPMSAVCAYDRRELGDQVIAELACVHETGPAGDVMFRLHPGATTAEVILDGEVDLSVEELFGRALRRTDLRPAGGEVVLDAGGLKFIDHRSLLTLQRFAEARRTTAVLRTRFAGAVHLARLLDLPHVRVEVTR